MSTTSQVPWWLPIIAGALSGGITGAVSGIIIGPTKAEREERGKRRIEARKNLANTIRSFRYSVSETRLKKYNLRAKNPPVDYEDVRLAALRLGSAIQREKHVLPFWERTALSRKGTEILGANILTWADLRPSDIDDASEDSTLLHAVANERQGPNKAAFSEWLLTQPPTSESWDRLLSEIDKLRRKYP